MTSKKVSRVVLAFTVGALVGSTIFNPVFVPAPVNMPTRPHEHDAKLESSFLETQADPEWHWFFDPEADDIDLRTRYQESLELIGAELHLPPIIGGTPSRKAMILSAISGIPIGQAETLYRGAVEGDQSSRNVIRKLKRKFKHAVKPWDWRDRYDKKAIKSRMRQCMKQVKKAYRLAKTGFLTYEDARGLVEKAEDGSRDAWSHVRAVREAGQAKRLAEDGYGWEAVSSVRQKTEHEFEKAVNRRLEIIELTRAVEFMKPRIEGVENETELKAMISDAEALIAKRRALLDVEDTNRVDASLNLDLKIAEIGVAVEILKRSADRHEK